MNVSRFPVCMDCFSLCSGSVSWRYFLLLYKWRLILHSTGRPAQVCCWVTWPKPLKHRNSHKQQTHKPRSTNKQTPACALVVCVHACLSLNSLINLTDADELAQFYLQIGSRSGERPAFTAAASPVYFHSTRQTQGQLTRLRSYRCLSGHNWRMFTLTAVSYWQDTSLVFFFISRKLCWNLWP